VKNNFALESGVVAVDLDGSFEIRDSLISKNFAYSNQISKIVMSSHENRITNSSFSNNILLSSSSLSSELLTCIHLCFIPFDIRA